MSCPILLNRFQNHFEHKPLFSVTTELPSKVVCNKSLSTQTHETLKNAEEDAVNIPSQIIFHAN